MRDLVLRSVFISNQSGSDSVRVYSPGVCGGPEAALHSRGAGVKKSIDEAIRFAHVFRATNGELVISTNFTRNGYCDKCSVWQF